MTDRFHSFEPANHTEIFLDDELTIRPADPEDAESICTVHNDSILALCKEMYSLGELLVWTESTTPRRMREALRDESVKAHIAECGDRVAGFSFVMSDLIRGVYVLPEFSRQGVGSALLAVAEANARQEGIGLVRLYATLNSVPFYISRGYSAVRESRFPMTENLSLPCLVMEKDLTAG